MIEEVEDAQRMNSPVFKTTSSGSGGGPKRTTGGYIVEFKDGAYLGHSSSRPW